MHHACARSSEAKFIHKIKSNVVYAATNFENFGSTSISKGCLFYASMNMKTLICLVICVWDACIFPLLTDILEDIYR